MARRFFSPASAALLSTLVALSPACSRADAPTSPSGPDEAALEAGVPLKATAPVSPDLVAGLATPRFALDAPPFEYRFEVLTPDGRVVATSPKVAPGPDGQVRWKVTGRLELDSPYQWRARAELGERVGPWAS